MKKTWTLPLAIIAMTLITASLSAPFAHADLRPSSEPAGEDEDAFGGPPHSIAFHSNREGNNEIYVMNPDGSDQNRLTFESRGDIRPDISPNGRQIVFVSNRIIPETNPTGDFEIFVMNSDGSDVRQLTFNEAEDMWPRWSPNGKLIAFHSNVDGNFEIYVVGLHPKPSKAAENQRGKVGLGMSYGPNGTDLTRVTEYAGLDQYPEWSPDGKQLAIRRDTDLYLIDLDGSNPIQLTAEAIGFNQMASWSPDGKQLAFLSTREGYGSVFVINADGSNLVNLTPKPDDVPAGAWFNRAPAWSRNGRHIYFTSRRPAVSVNENIFVMNADGSGVTQLTFTTAPRVSAEAAVR